MTRKKKPARIHVQIAAVVSGLRGALRATQEEPFQFGRGREYAEGANDAIFEIVRRYEILFGEGFTRQWEATRP